MDIKAYDQRIKRLELREKLLDIEEKRFRGVKDFDAREVLSEIHRGCHI